MEWAFVGLAVVALGCCWRLSCRVALLEERLDDARTAIALKLAPRYDAPKDCGYPVILKFPGNGSSANGRHA